MGSAFVAQPTTVINSSPKSLSAAGITYNLPFLNSAGGYSGMGTILSALNNLSFTVGVTGFYSYSFAFEFGDSGATSGGFTGNLSLFNGSTSVSSTYFNITNPLITTISHSGMLYLNPTQYYPQLIYSNTTGSAIIYGNNVASRITVYKMF